MNIVDTRVSEDEDSAGDLSDIFEAPGATVVDTNLEQDSGESIIDELLSDSPTPVDEFLTATPNRVESPEVFTDSATAEPVMRFDDNTPLPDDFDLNEDEPYTAQPPPPEVEPVAPIVEVEDSQVDLAFGEPDEWIQLLGEVGESLAELSDDLATDVEDEAPEPEPETSVATEPSDDAADPPDMDTQFAIQAEAMGIDLSGMHQSVASDDDETGVDDLDADEQEPPSPDTADERAAAPPIDRRMAAPELALEDDLEDELDDEPASEAALEDDDAYEDIDLFDEEKLPSDEQAVAELDLEDEDNLDDDAESDAEAELQVDDAAEEEPEQELSLSDDSDDDESDLETDDEADEELERQLTTDESETSIDEDLIAAAFENEAAQYAEEPGDAAPAEDDETSGEHYVPPQTEEEMTINMMIDQDFMRLAAEGEDIFTSTTVENRPAAEVAPNVETIVMEGDFVRTALENEALADGAASGSGRDSDATAAAIAANIAGADAYANRHIIDRPAYGLIAAAVLLVLVLVGQVLHQSREALATVPTFNEIVGPIYRMAGQPLTPDWDITGWRFEAATSKRSAEDNVLTIYARIGNTTEDPLPYPLVHLSLIDLKLDVVGSKVLEPKEYLAGNPDPRKPVAPGETVDAVISINSAPENADGFKLAACYRLANGQLSCAIPSFK